MVKTEKLVVPAKCNGESAQWYGGGLHPQGFRAGFLEEVASKLELDVWELAARKRNSTNLGQKLRMCEGWGWESPGCLRNKKKVHGAAAPSSRG